MCVYVWLYMHKHTTWKYIHYIKVTHIKMYARKKSLLSVDDSKLPSGKEPKVKTVFKGALYFISTVWTFYNKKIFTYIYVIFEMKNIFKHTLVKKNPHTKVFKGNRNHILLPNPTSLRIQLRSMIYVQLNFSLNCLKHICKQMCVHTHTHMGIYTYVYICLCMWAHIIDRIAHVCTY